MVLPRPCHLLLLLLVLQLVPGQARAPCPASCRCRQRLLGCSRANLTAVPRAARRWAVSVLNLNGNSISSIEKQVWREYPWAEYLVLRDNHLRAVKRHSLEGLLLLRHLDLSSNEILSMEEHAFEPLPFLQFINLSGNLITQIQNNTFQAWHGMQFLRKVILSRNPLSVIDDTSFFELPAVKSLDLGATQVTQLTLLTLLLTTARLETLKVPKDAACCLCQEQHTSANLCRTIRLRCKDLCSSSAPQCAARTDSLAEKQAAIMRAARPSKLATARTVLSLRPKYLSLGDQGTITLAVILRLGSSSGNLSNSRNHTSRTLPYFPQHTPGQELSSLQHTRWTRDGERRKLYFLAKALLAELGKKLHMAPSGVTAESTVSPTPTSAVHKTPEQQTAPGRAREQRDVALPHTALSPRGAAGSYKANDSPAAFRPHKRSSIPAGRSLQQSPAEASRLAGSVEIPNSSRAAAQPKETHGAGGAGDAGVRAALSPRQGDARASKGHRQQGSPELNKTKQLSSQVLHKVNPDKEPPPTKSAAEQRPTTGRSSSSSRPTASSTAAAPAGTASLHTTSTRSEHPKKGPDVLSAPSSSGSPEDALLQGDLFESNVKQHLLSPVPNEALRAFIARVGRALRVDCLLPPLQPSCSKLLAQTGLLVELLGQHRAPSPAGRCLLPGNADVAQGSTAGSNLTGEGKPAQTSGNRVLLALSVSLIIVINVTVVCLIEVCCPKPAAAPRRSSRKSRWRWFLQKLQPRRWCRSQADSGEQGSDCSEQNKPQWLRDLYLPLDDLQKKAIYQLYEEEPSEEEDVFNKAELITMPTAPEEGSEHRETQPLMSAPDSSAAPQEPREDAAVQQGPQSPVQGDRSRGPS